MNYNAALGTKSSGYRSGEDVTREEVAVVRNAAVSESIAESVRLAHQDWQERLHDRGHDVPDGTYQAGVRSGSKLSVRNVDLHIADLLAGEPSATLDDVANGSNSSSNSKHAEFNVETEDGGRRFVRVFDNASALGYVTHSEDVITLAPDGTLSAVRTYSMYDQMSGASSEHVTNIAEDAIPNVIESVASIIAGAIEECEPLN